MKDHINMKWKTGLNNTIDYTEIESIITEHIDKNGKVIIGSDSMLTSNKIVFVNAICLLGENSPYDRKFFYKRYLNNDQSNKNLMVRLMNESISSLNIANSIKEKHSNADIEIHIDVNNNSKFLSNKYASSLIGYITGSGFKYKIKPEAFAASWLADKYSRPSKSFIVRNLFDE